MSLLLSDALSALQAAAEAGLEAAGIALPRRSAIWHSAPVIDWAEHQESDGTPLLLGVWADGISARPYGENRPSGSPGEAQLTGFTSVALLRCQVWVCYPNLKEAGSAPEPAEVSDGAMRAADAAWAIWVELCARRDAETLMAAVATSGGGQVFTKRDIGIGSAKPLAPQGYAAGWQVNIELGLPAVLQQ